MRRTDDEVALAIIMAIRDMYGPDVKGVGPTGAQLQNHEDFAECDIDTLLAGARRAQARGWVIVEEVIGKPMVGVNILEAGQEYLDHLGWE